VSPRPGRERICVFCGANPGDRPSYAAAARELGTAIVRRGLGLVYGGGSVGLMGAIADAVLAAGGEAIGVIPESLVARELAHGGLTELRVVKTMHERKATMAALSSAFVTLPGGFGTLDETCEVLSWAQLGLHAKPCGILDVEGYFGPWIEFLDRAVREGFVHPRHRELLLLDTDPDRLLGRLTEPGIETKKKTPRGTT
jgi:uncharacterized protein (TIGR00730 family)